MTTIKSTALQNPRVPLVKCLWGMEGAEAQKHQLHALPVTAHVCSLGHIAALVWMIFRGTWGAPKLGSNYTFATYLSYGTEKSPNSFDSQFSRLYSGYNNYPSLAWMPHGTCKIKKIYTVPNPALPEDS